ncbi:hypothetical protein BKA61DRAFT_567461 [Leptodontidium sp. MPI-SDFR-AT-0119]|nr:hypothetical protein BKA61DRAFT_567461 [Leptodontidium sp. MPI-SDFR-AT-0119]
MSDKTCNERIFNPTPYFLGPNRIQALEQPSDIIHHILHRDKTTGLSHLVFNNLKAKKRVDRTLKVDNSTLVIAIDGITHPPPPQPASNNPNPISIPSPSNKNNFPSNAKANVKSRTRTSYGVYFGPSSPHNKTSFLPPSSPSRKFPQTKETAILRGCYDGLDCTSSLPSSPLKTMNKTPRATKSKNQAQVPQTKTPSLLPDILNNLLPPLAPKKIIITTDSPYLVKCLAQYVYVWESNGYRDSRGEYVENSEELADLAVMVEHFERVGVEVNFWLVGGEYVGEARRLAGEAVEGVVEKVEGEMEREGKGKAEGDEVEILGLNLNMKSLDLGCDLEALELELEKGFVNF